jgi:amino acid transporter
MLPTQTPPWAVPSPSAPPPAAKQQPPRTRVESPLLSEYYCPRVLPALLGTGDLTSLFLLNVFWVTNVTPLAAGGTASFTYWLIGGTLFFIPCSLVLAQLAALFPSEGGIYAWTAHAFGPRWAFFVGICAWLPGVLSIVNAAAAFVSCLQALNPGWLATSWQQGLAIGGVLAFTALLSCQRTRRVQHVLNAAVVLMGLATLLIGVSAVIWLASGHPSATSFIDASRWRVIPFGSQTNLALLGSVVLALMGSDMPLAMGAEISSRHAIPRHLAWGTLLTLGGYLPFTFALLAVQGASAAASTVNPLLLVITTVDQVFGKVGGNIMALCLLFYFLMIPVALNVCFSRLFLVAAIDGRVSVWFAKLNRNRVPIHALLTQIGIAAIFAAILYLLVPQVGFFGNAASFTSEAYNVLGASLLLVWAISFMFPFLDVAALFLRNRAVFRKLSVVPLPLLGVSVVVGTLLCGTTIIITLFNSFIPTLIADTTWPYVVGGITLIWLTICAIGSMVTTSQATWEQMAEIGDHP